MQPMQAAPCHAPPPQSAKPPRRGVCWQAYPQTGSGVGCPPHSRTEGSGYTCRTDRGLRECPHGSAGSASNRCFCQSSLTAYSLSPTHSIRYRKSNVRTQVQLRSSEIWTYLDNLFVISMKDGGVGLENIRHLTDAADGHGKRNRAENTIAMRRTKPRTKENRVRHLTRLEVCAYETAVNPAPPSSVRCPAKTPPACEPALRSTRPTARRE